VRRNKAYCEFVEKLNFVITGKEGSNDVLL